MALKTKSSSKSKSGEVLVNKMENGEVFKYTSTKDPANSGLYLKVVSTKNRAINLGNFKAYTFLASEKGLPVDAEINVLGK